MTRRIRITGWSQIRLGKKWGPDGWFKTERGIGEAGIEVCVVTGGGNRLEVVVIVWPLSLFVFD